MLTVKYCSQQSYAFGQVKCFCKFSVGAEIKNIAFVYPLECCAPCNRASKRDDGIIVDLYLVSTRCIAACN